jgi:hypothetical protein
MTSLPLVPLIGAGTQRIQPVHIDDLTDLIIKIAGSGCCYGRKIPVVGPEPLEFREYLAELRAAMGLGRARFVRVPRMLAGTMLSLGARMHLSWASADSLAMLERGNTAPVGEMARVLGRLPRAPREFIKGDLASWAARNAKWTWLSVLMRLAIAAVWLTAGVVSAGIYPIERSVALVEATGVGPGLSTALVYLGAALDVSLGVATLTMRRRSLLWLAQIAVITVYTIIITLWLPEFWLHPFGPVIKNLPLVIAIYLVYEFERS